MGATTGKLKFAYETISNMEAKIKELELLLKSDGMEWEAAKEDLFYKWVLLQKIDGIVRIKNELFEFRPLQLTGYKAVKIAIQFTQD